MSKEEFIKVLIEKGYKAVLSDSGVVMVLTDKYPAECHRIAKIAAQTGYRHSWGIKPEAQNDRSL